MPKTIIETHKLYNGRVELLYYPTSHAYKVNGDKKMGVSSVPDIIDKPGLRYYYMNEALSHVYRSLVPGNDGKIVTPTIKELEKALIASKMAHKTKSDRGKENGTRIHEWLEEFLIAFRDRKAAPVLPTSIKLKSNPKTWDEIAKYEVGLEFNNLIDALNEFVGWFNNHEIEVVALEDIVYSEKYDYAGRFDAILRIDGQLILVDFKSNNPSQFYPDGIFPEMFCQIGGYDIARTEEYAPDLHIKNQSMFDGHAIFNFSKKTGRFKKKFVGEEEVKANRLWFLHALGTKRLDQYFVRKMSTQYKENRK